MRRADDRFPVRREESWGLSPWAESGSPWQMMRRMQEDMDRIFGQMLGGTGSWPGATGSTTGGQQGMQTWSPSVDISQTDREWCIEADLPGISKDDIEVQVHDHHLILSAQLNQSSETPAGGNGQSQQGQQGQQGRQYHRRERRYGYFQRVIPLPENVDEEQINCDFKDGLLCVHVPKGREAQQGPRRIPVSAGSTQGAISTSSTGGTGSAGPGGSTESGRGRGMTGPQGNTAMSGTTDRTGTAGGSDMVEEADERRMAGAKGGQTASKRAGTASKKS